MCNRSTGPIFGDGIDLIIYDKADKNNDSFADIGSSYKN